MDGFEPNTCCYCDQHLPPKGTKQSNRAWAKHMANCAKRKKHFADKNQRAWIELEIAKHAASERAEDLLLQDLRQLERAGCNSELSDAIIQVIEKMIERAK